MKIIFVLLLLISQNVFSQELKEEIYKGSNCFVYAETIKFIENNKNKGISKEQLRKEIMLSIMKKDLKLMFLKNVDFVYNLKDIKNYGISLRKQCLDVGYIRFQVVKNDSSNKSREEL